MITRKTILAFAIGLIGASAGPGFLATEARGQIVYGEPGRATLRPQFTYWNLAGDQGEINLRQFVMASAGYLPIREDLEARYYIASSTSEVDVAGRNYGLRGLGDLRLQLNRTLANDRYMLGLGVNLPTGKTELGAGEDFMVMGFLLRDFLAFPVRRLGGGFELNLLAGAAFASGSYRLGATASYDHAGVYQAYRDEGDYNPGDRATVQFAVQRGGAKWQWSGDATFATSSDDELSGQRVFSAGDQLEMHLGGQRAAPHALLAIDASYLVRGRNDLYDSAERIASRLRVYGDEFSLQGRLIWRDAKRWSAGPVLELRWNDANELGQGMSRSAGLGGQSSLALGNGYRLGALVMLYRGEVDGGHLALRGLQTALTLGREF